MNDAEIAGVWWSARRPEPADLAALTELGRAQPHARWIGIDGPDRAARAEVVLGEFLRGTDGAFGDTLLLIDAATQAIAGVISATERPTQRLEITYGTAPAFRRRGLATAALTALTQTALAREPERVVELRIDPVNTSSARVAERSGFRLDQVMPDGDLVYVRLASAMTEEP